MKINTKILLGFSGIILLCVLALGVRINNLNKIINNTIQIKDVESALEIMTTEESYYVVTLIEEVHGALLHAQKGEYQDVTEHKTTYNQIIGQERELRENIKILLNLSEAPSLAKAKSVQQLDIIEKSIGNLVALGQQGFTAIEQKDLPLASDLLVGGNHKIYKAQLLGACQALAKNQQEITIGVRNEILKETQFLVKFNFYIAMLEILIVVAVLMVLRSFIHGLTFKKK